MKELGYKALFADVLLNIFCDEGRYGELGLDPALIRKYQGYRKKGEFADVTDTVLSDGGGWCQRLVAIGTRLKC